MFSDTMTIQIRITILMMILIPLVVTLVLLSTEFREEEEDTMRMTVRLKQMHLSSRVVSILTTLLIGSMPLNEFLTSRPTWMRRGARSLL